MKKKYSTRFNIKPFTLFFIGCLLCTSDLQAQITRKVLFLGNSYTGVNNLPQLVYDVALSAGDTLIFDSNTPGGYRLTDHYANGVSQNKIMAGGWQYVVLQGQSQEPIVQSGTFTNGGKQLHTFIKQHNPCAVTQLYMTWGRKNGDASNCVFFPDMCTYQSMDSSLRNKYINLAIELNGEISPVSVVWNYLRQHHPNLELYQPDESHPSLAGSYAAACCFYATLFKKNPEGITFNSGLNPADASIIRNAVKTQVFDQLNAWDFYQLPVSGFNYQIGSGTNEVLFQASNPGTQQTYAWDFGDGATSAVFNPTHSYGTNGTYTVTLTKTNCNLQGVHTSITDTVIQFCNHTPTVYTSNTLLCSADTLWTQPADAYQWFVYGTPIPETNPYLTNYPQYAYSGFSVMSTLNGCSELSETYTQMPQWSGYFFDALGDPCQGDTVKFAILHINGSLFGTEQILWFKNDTLLSTMTNEDTLFITTPGTYTCKVIDPISDCPLDTTSYEIAYDCQVLDVEEPEPEISWTVFPNPASETLTIALSHALQNEQVRIFNSMGMLTHVVEVSGVATLNISGLPNGIYFMHLQNSKLPPVKFIKQ